MPTTDLRLSARRPGWVDDARAGVRRDGYAIVEDVLGADLLERTRAAMYEVQRRIVADLGPERLARAGELGVLRLMLGYDESFCRLLELEEVLAVVDRTVSSTAVLHLQNGLILPPAPAGEAPDRFQTSFHRDFPRHLDGYLASINTFLAIDEFTAENGATLLVPGSHQRPDSPTRDELEAAIPSVCPAGSMIVFDSTLWHAAGANRSGRDRLAVNQQFTRSFIKPQIDYVRALGDEAVLRQPPRTQQLLGWYTRVVTSLDEYYRPAAERLYRGGQG
ncbi:MAG TPA: phytanoyl-CoA dioxygenase family protein [Solirubrobacteraceae bacterium]|nr:phytanoyl-CoA dioxygenase family protein [Solirubrobacteraceae bacterium]